MNAPICCPKFDPAPWQDKIFTWEGKRFVKDRVWSFYYMPMNFGMVMRRLDAQVRAADAVMPEYLCLADHTSKWKIDIYAAVDKEIPGANNVKLSGRFLSRVYEGPFSDTGKWCQDFESYAREQSLFVHKCYMWYTTCPKCAKKYGKNYVVIVGQVPAA